MKELEKQTARATDEIRHRIDSIRRDTEEVEASILGISETIHQVGELQGKISDQVGTHCDESSKTGLTHSGAIVPNLTRVTRAAEGTSESASATKTDDDEVSRLDDRLERLVSRFKY